MTPGGRLSADEVFAFVRDAVVAVLEIPTDRVTRATRLVADLGADSIALVEVVELVEETLAPLVRPGFHIEDEDLDGLVTVGDAVDYVLARAVERS